MGQGGWAICPSERTLVPFRYDKEGWQVIQGDTTPRKERRPPNRRDRRREDQGCAEQPQVRKGAAHTGRCSSLLWLRRKHAGRLTTSYSSTVRLMTHTGVFFAPSCLPSGPAGIAAAARSKQMAAPCDWTAFTISSPRAIAACMTSHAWSYPNNRARLASICPTNSASPSGPRHLAAHGKGKSKTSSSHAGANSGIPPCRTSWDRSSFSWRR